METMLDLPTITGLPTDPVSTAIMAQAKPTAPTATLKETALASFVPIEAHMKTLAARYKDVAYDVTTTKGMADAKAARLVLREEGRYAVQRLQERLKKEANDLKRTLDAKGDELIALVKPAEDAIHAQIEAEEDRKAAAKAEAERIERERVAALESRLAGLSVWIDRCKVPGITSERIRNGIALLEQAPIDDTWADFKDRAVQRRADILGVMQGLYQERLIAEVEAQRLEEQRAEQARIDALLAARKAELDAQAAELLRREEEIRAAEKARAEAEAPAVPVAHAVTYSGVIYSGGPHASVAPLRFADDGEEQFGVIEVVDRDQTDAEIEAANGPEVDPFPAPAVESDSTPPAVVEPATLKIGTIGKRLGFDLRADFITGTLRVTPAAVDRGLPRFCESQWPGIKTALIRHIEAA